MGLVEEMGAIRFALIRLLVEEDPVRLSLGVSRLEGVGAVGAGGAGVRAGRGVVDGGDLADFAGVGWGVGDGRWVWGLDWAEVGMAWGEDQGGEVAGGMGRRVCVARGLNLGLTRDKPAQTGHA